MDVGESLNPCFVGMWSFRAKSPLNTESLSSLNPCFVGMWSFRQPKTDATRTKSVLILVLLGCGLLDYGITGKTPKRKCLNPCFVGMWSFRAKNVYCCLLVFWLYFFVFFVFFIE